MDKNIIKQYLSKTFIHEVTENIPKETVDVKPSAKPNTGFPAAKLGNQIAKQNKTVNTQGVKDIAKNIKSYEKSEKQKDPDEKEMAVNKFNYNTKQEEEYHDQMEIMNGQEMIQYDREPDELYKERAYEAIEGSTRMGNNPEWANVVEEPWGGSPEFGKKLVQRIKNSVNLRNKETPTIRLQGRDIQADRKDYGNKPYAIGTTKEGTKAKKIMTEGILADDNYTHFAIDKNTHKILEAWNYSDVDKAELMEFKKDYFYKDLKEKDLPIKMSDIKIVTESVLKKEGINPEDVKNWNQNKDKPEADVSQADISGDDYEKSSREVDVQGQQRENTNKNKPQIKENMKRLRFKKEFNGVGNALKLIPESYKIDKKTFEMTDGNENYRIRWEGSIQEGAAVILTASDKTMVNEDVQRMKALFNYKSQDTLGTVKGKDRISENTEFSKIWAKTKALLEGDEIEGADAEEGQWDENVEGQAKEAKEHIEGTTSTDKGTQAPAPKTGEFDKVAISQAPEAKKHIEGTTSTDKGTQAPKPKEGYWDKIKTSAPEATKDVKKK